MLRVCLLFISAAAASGADLFRDDFSRLPPGRVTVPSASEMLPSRKREEESGYLLYPAQGEGEGFENLAIGHLLWDHNG